MFRSKGKLILWSEKGEVQDHTLASVLLTGGGRGHFIDFHYPEGKWAEFSRDQCSWATQTSDRSAGQISAHIQPLSSWIECSGFLHKVQKLRNQCSRFTQELLVSSAWGKASACYTLWRSERRPSTKKKNKKWLDFILLSGFCFYFPVIVIKLCWWHYYSYYYVLFIKYLKLVRYV